MGKIIGITTQMSRSEAIKKIKKNHLEGINRSEVSSDYANAISDSGGIPLLIPLLENYDKKKVQDIIQCIDGLLLTGGEDIDPMYFNEQPLENKAHELMKIDQARDSFEMALLKEAFKVQKPILGICRGHQLINVCFGGSLYQDVESHLASLDDKTKLVHSVMFKENSILEEIFNAGQLKVNSFHHQSIHQLAKDFQIIACSSDQVIEGIEYNGHQWILGVQWHPEMLYKKYKIHQNLFEKFIEVVSQNSHKKS